MEVSHVGDVSRIEAECFSSPFKEKDLISYLSDTLWHFLVAVDENGTVLGHISLSIILDECQIVNVAVDPSYRRQGIGKNLVSGAISLGGSNGAKKFFLEVRKSNASAISLYNALGFLQVGVSKNHYSQPREDAFLMNLEL